MNGAIFFKTEKRFGMLVKNAIRYTPHFFLMDTGRPIPPYSPDLPKTRIYTRNVNVYIFFIFVFDHLRFLTSVFTR